MTDEEFKKWEKLVHKVSKKYINNSYGLDADDLFQIGAIGLMKAHSTYALGEVEIPEITYYKNNINWNILNEFKKHRKLNSFMEVSLYTAIEDNLTIEDTLADIRLNVEFLVEDRFIIEKYYSEFEKHLDPLELEVYTSLIFEEKAPKDIADELEIDNTIVYNVSSRARRKLITRSYYIREKYIEYKQLDRNYYSADPYALIR